MPRELKYSMIDSRDYLVKCFSFAGRFEASGHESATVYVIYLPSYVDLFT